MSDDAFTPLVTAEWLTTHAGDSDLVLLDVRVSLTESGPAGAVDAYRGGHIPGAVFADLPNVLCDAGQPIAFALPSPEAFCTAMGRLGVGDDTRVVLYDDRRLVPGGAISSLWAARAWWMLRWVGFDRAALLDGGYQAWLDAGLPTCGGEEHNPARVLSPQPRPHLVADSSEVRAALAHVDVTLLDSLDADHFAGNTGMYARRGHIPGAVNQPFIDLYDATGRFRPAGELAAMHTGLPAGRIITYCGAGIAASASAFAMTLAGLPDVAVYTGSLQEWTADAANPMELGGATTGC